MSVIPYNFFLGMFLLLIVKCNYRLPGGLLHKREILFFNCLVSWDENKWGVCSM